MYILIYLRHPGHIYFGVCHVEKVAGTWLPGTKQARGLGLTFSAGAEPQQEPLDAARGSPTGPVRLSACPHAADLGQRVLFTGR